jgi:alkaline phosphatase
MFYKIVLFLWCVLLFVRAPLAWSEPKNVILLIGDGMGFEHVRATPP